MKTTMSMLWAVALVAGCGGGGGEGSEGTTPPATDDSGRAITTAGGETVSVVAHNHWQRGVTAFQAAEEAGWNPSRCESVAEPFEEAVEAQSGAFAEAIYMQGVVAARCGEEDDARRHYNQALSVNQTFCKARAAVGLMELEGGNANAARATFERAIRDDARCTEAYTNLAIIQRRQNQSAEALNNLRRALAIESDYLPAFNQMALLHYEAAGTTGDQRRLDLAEVVCRQAQLIERDYAPIYNTWGLIKVAKGDIIEALRMFERATNLDNSMYEAFMNFGQINLSFRGYESARAAFARSVELRARSYDAHIGLGAALRGLNQMEPAQQQYEAAIQIDGNRPEAYFNLGILYQDYRNGTPADLNQAKQYYQQFLAKARGQAAYANAIEAVERRCQTQQQGQRRRRRARSTDCRPGRLQNIDETISALDEVAQIEREAAALQRQAEQQQQQQEQQQPEGGGGE